MLQLIFSNESIDNINRVSSLNNKLEENGSDDMTCKNLQEPTNKTISAQVDKKKNSEISASSTSSSSDSSSSESDSDNSSGKFFI